MKITPYIRFIVLGLALSVPCFPSRGDFRAVQGAEERAEIAKEGAEKPTTIAKKGAEKMEPATPDRPLINMAVAV